MLTKIQLALITVFIISFVFVGIFLLVSNPWGGPKKVLHFFQGILLRVSRTVRIIKMIKNRGVKNVHRKYPKTVDWIVSSFIFIITIIIITFVVLVYASLFGGLAFLFTLM
jgi:hypothetical protein